MAESYSNRIKELRIAKQMNQEQLAEMLDVTKQAVSQYERGSRKPSIPILESLCDIFNVSADYLLGKDDVTIRFVGKEGIEKLESHHGVRIPVFDRVAAGIPIDAVDEIVDWEEISESLSRTGEFFGLRIKGDSMMPRIAEGDVVIVKQQPDAETGDIVIVRINGDYATCKKLVKHANGISLISFNPMYEPMCFSNEEILSKPVEILGKVVENRQKY